MNCWPDGETGNKEIHMCSVMSCVRSVKHMLYLLSGCIHLRMMQIVIFVIIMLKPLLFEKTIGLIEELKQT